MKKIKESKAESNARDFGADIGTLGRDGSEANPKVVVRRAPGEQAIKANEVRLALEQ
ncbi:MAG TPA: hypothetical protein VIG69_12980 [Candidatus Methylomirabilis sp.]